MLNFEINKYQDMVTKKSLFKVYIALSRDANKQVITWQLENKFGKQLSHKLSMVVEDSNSPIRIPNYMIKSRLEYGKSKLVNFGFDFTSGNKTISSETYLDIGSIETPLRVLSNDFKLATKSWSTARINKNK